MNIVDVKRTEKKLLQLRKRWIGIRKAQRERGEGGCGWRKCGNKFCF